MTVTHTDIQFAIIITPTVALVAFIVGEWITNQIRGVE